MRPSVCAWLLVGAILAPCFGCTSRNGRAYHGDPFAEQPKKHWNDFLIDTQPPAASTAQADARSTKPKSQASSARDQFMLTPVPQTGDSEDEAAPVIPASAHESTREAQPKLGGGMDHAPDYSWIQGKLEFSALGGGVWKARYAPISADDEHGGSVILDCDPTKKELKPGDMVFVEGQLMPGEQSRSFRNPQYRVRRMVRIEE